MEKLKLHDRHSFETKEEAGLDHWSGKVSVEVEAHAASDSDLGMQFLHTISEMDEEELIELYRNDVIQLDVERTNATKTEYQ
jgi:hypothetical protein